MHKGTEKEVQKLGHDEILHIISSRIALDQEVPQGQGPSTSRGVQDNANVERKPTATESLRKRTLTGLRPRKNIVKVDQFDWANRLIPSFQLGVDVALSQLANKELRDLLFHDFFYIEIINFSPDILNKVKREHETFKLKVYAPMAFAHFRKLFNVKEDVMRKALCENELNMVANAGASGSIFYVSPDRQFVLKTVTKKEAKFLQELLPEYYMNIHQNPNTFLPRFFGLYVVKRNSWVMRLVIMHNIIGVDEVEQKFDLKGSRYHRFYNAERDAGTVGTQVPTMKDLDFIDIYPNGLVLSDDIYKIVSKTLERDVLVLQSFGIMDYSLLLAIRTDTELLESAEHDKTSHEQPHRRAIPIGRQNSYCEIHKRHHCFAPACRTRRLARKLAEIVLPCGGIPAVNPRGAPLVIYMGIIDILQDYGIRKIMEHCFKSMCLKGNIEEISVQPPEFYAFRFSNFITHSVFGRAPENHGPPLTFPPIASAPTEEDPDKRQDTRRPPREEGNSKSNPKAPSSKKQEKPGKPGPSVPMSAGKSRGHSEGDNSSKQGSNNIFPEIKSNKVTSTNVEESITTLCQRHTPVMFDRKDTPPAAKNQSEEARSRNTSRRSGSASQLSKHDTTLNKTHHTDSRDRVTLATKKSSHGKMRLPESTSRRNITVTNRKKT